MDKQQKKALKRRARMDRRAAADAEWGEHMVLSPDELKALLDHLDVELPKNPCDHRLRLTNGWAEANGIDAAALAESLAQFGGGCDCEVLANVDPETQVDGWPAYLARFRSA